MLNINRTASIIIPTFNRAELLPRAIESALNQSYPCEVIVCDHGSVDNTPEVANKYKGQIIYIRKEKDSGPIACWKDGLENALCGVYCDTEYATVGATYRSFNHTYKADKCKKCLRLSNV